MIGTRRVGRRLARRWRLAAGAVAVFAAVAGPGALPARAADPASADPVERGAYVLAAAGCASCHTAAGPEAAPLAGGRALETPFGTFYAPNITPDPEHGIGRWTEADFRRALREGRAPAGFAYFPSFPYTAYTGMTDGDIADLWAYLRTVPPSPQADREHDLDPPFGWRWLLPVWRALNFSEGPVEAPLGQRPEAWYRGAYLVEVLGHCGQCHTPRDRLGGLQEDRHLAGAAAGPDGRRVPNITPDRAAGIGRWSQEDLIGFLEIGMTPDGDFAAGAMQDVITNTTSKLTDADRRAMAIYLRSLPPIGQDARN